VLVIQQQVKRTDYRAKGKIVLAIQRTEQERQLSSRRMRVLVIQQKIAIKQMVQEY
jgi:hypothetical protein